MSNKTGHKSHPTKSGLKAPSWLPKPKIGKSGRNPNGSGTPKTLPPHHLAGHTVMRRERKPRIERASEDPPAPSPRRACRDEEGEPTKTRAGSRSPPQESNSWTPSPRMNRGDRSERPEAPPPLWCSGSMLASHARGPGFNPRAG